MNIKIFFDEDNEYSEFTYYEKDCRFGIIVVLNEKKYKINVYGITRLNQEFNECIKNNEIFFVEPNLIIVKDVTKQNIIDAILCISNEYIFFSQLKIENDIDLSKYVNVY